MAPLKVEQYVVGPVQTNCYFAIIDDTKEVLVIDPGASADQLAKKICQEKLTPIAILLTHGHFDHAGGAEELAKHFDIPLVQAMFPSKKYNVWTQRNIKAKSYDVLFGLYILLPLAPDDYLCYFSGLINMSVKKFILIILLAKPWCILFYSFGTGMIIH